MLDPDRTDLGHVERDGDAVVLTYERRLAHPPEKVWRAITESDHLRHWFPADILGNREEGAELKIAFWPESIERAGEEIEAAGLSLDDAVIPGRLVTWEPVSDFVFTWGSERLQFRLEPDRAGTLLRVTIRAEKPAPRGYASTATGYHVCIDALAAHVAGHEADLFDPSRTATLEEIYAHLL